MGIQGRAFKRAVACLFCLATAMCASAVADTTDAHNQGLNLGQSELDRVGTNNITKEKAQANVPFYKDQPVQRSTSTNDSNLFYDMGTGRINGSKTYQPGKCDREGFDPAAEAQKGVGADKWSRMTQSQRSDAIKNQQTYFDQECEGVNFLAGQYPTRVQYEVPPGDGLNDWHPAPANPDTNSACTQQTISTPDEFQMNYCNQSPSKIQEQCSEEAEIQTWSTGGIAQGYYSLHSSASGAGSSSIFQLLSNGTFACTYGSDGPASGTSCAGGGSTGSWTANCEWADGAGVCVKGTTQYSAQMQADNCTVAVTMTLPNGYQSSSSYNFCSPRAPGQEIMQQSWGPKLGPSTTLLIDRVTSEFVSGCNPNNGCQSGTTVTTNGHSATYVQTRGNGVIGTSQWTAVDLPDGCYVRITRTSTSPTQLVHDYDKYMVGVYNHFTESEIEPQDIPSTETFDLNFCRDMLTYTVNWRDGCLPYKNVSQ